MPARMNKHARAAADRDQEKAGNAKAAKEQADDDASWADSGSKQQQKKAAQAAAAAAKKHEKQASKDVAVAQERERETKDVAKIPAKVSKDQIAKDMAKMRGAEAQKAKKQDPKMVSAEDQDRAFEKHEQKLIDEATGAEVNVTGLKDTTEALGNLAIAVDKKEEQHPERRMKAAHQAYEEKNIPRLKAENPGLKRSQLKDVCWKEWQKSPENPMVQAMQRKMDQSQASAE